MDSKTSIHNILLKEILGLMINISFFFYSQECRSIPPSWKAVQQKILFDPGILLLFCFKILFIYFWLCWFFVAFLVVVCGLLIAVAFLFAEHGLQGAAGSRSCDSCAPEHRLNSCGVQAQLLLGLWGLPELGIELMSPALAGGFFTTEPPWKPPGILLGIYTKEIIRGQQFICEGSHYHIIINKKMETLKCPTQGNSYTINKNSLRNTGWIFSQLFSH